MKRRGWGMPPVSSRSVSRIYVMIKNKNTYVFFFVLLFFFPVFFFFFFLGRGGGGGVGWGGGQRGAGKMNGF